MPEEIVTLTAANGATGEAVAEVVRYGSTSRGVRAAVFVFLGLAGGAACIIIPIVHLFTTWGLPLLGIVLGVRAWRVETRVASIAGACPACGEAITLLGGDPDEVARRECPKCRAALAVAIDDEKGS